MVKLPTIAIIGRPNTGKSTLFNRLVGRRKAIVSETAGTTRDHIAHTIDILGYSALLLDTGGMGGGTEDTDFEADVHAQSILALENADIILFTLNGREPITRSDSEIISILRKQKRNHVPVITVITKCDDPNQISSILPEFYPHIIDDELVAVSAPHKIGIDQLYTVIAKKLDDLQFTKAVTELEDTNTKIAIIGRPNVGKSSIINALMNEQQRKNSPMLVSDIAGTTRDSRDIVITYHETSYTFVDTAGLKRRKDTPEGIETHAYFRSIRSLEHCDIAVLVLDAKEPVSKQDKRIANLAIEEGKGLLILMNKWDALDEEQRVLAKQHITYELKFCSFAKFIPCSAQTRQGLLKIFEAIEHVHLNRQRRIPTKDLHRWLEDTLYNQPVGQLQKCKHITQADEVPPTFILFVRFPKQIQQSNVKFLENRLREVYDFVGSPIKWVLRESQKKAVE